jgi:hypothetical protein
MELLTKVNSTPSQNNINYQDTILLLGSCFADNIGAKFSQYYFPTTINPFGTLYNPASILEAIQLSMTTDAQHYLIQHNGLWHSMMHHGSFSHPNKDEVIHCCQTSLSTLRQALHDASTIIITFGTAWVYEYQGKIVANCHKLPSNQFVRRRLTVEQIVSAWRPLLASMPDKHWIFTLSPIRHIKDGLHENQISKAILLQAIEQLTTSCPVCSDTSFPRVDYFPSYEIMMDELRDYRFYAEDMVHPSSLAVDYIWQRFVDTYITSATQTEMRELHQLWRDRHHQFLHPESAEAQLFAQRTKTRLQQLQSRYPWIL